VCDGGVGDGVERGKFGRGGDGTVEEDLVIDDSGRRGGGGNLLGP